MWGPALRNHYLIHFVAAGKGRIIINDTEYSLQKGDGFITTPNKVAFYEADSEQPWEYYWVGFNGVDASRLVSAAGMSGSSPCFRCEDMQRIIDLIMDIYDSKGSSLHNEVAMSGALYRFFAYLIEQSGSEFDPSGRIDDYIELAVRYIEHNYSQPISVSDIAASAGISRSHLYRLFVQGLGITPNEYLVQYRINTASELLREKQINVSEAAYSSGFSDPLYFSRVFKKIKGVTPSKYALDAKENK